MTYNAQDLLLGHLTEGTYVATLTLNTSAVPGSEEWVSLALTNLGQSGWLLFEYTNPFPERDIPSPPILQISTVPVYQEALPTVPEFEPPFNARYQCIDNVCRVTDIAGIPGTGALPPINGNQ